MATLSSSGRLFYALAVTLIGIQFIIYSDFYSSLLPLHPAFTGRNLIMRSFGVFTFLCGFGMGFEKFPVQAALAFAAILLLILLFVHVPGIYAHPRDGEAWTAASELLAIATGALLFPANYGMNKLKRMPRKLFVRTALWSVTFFGFTLLVFGVQHFVYTEFVASIVPAWIPLANFVTYIAGLVFLACAALFIFRIRVQLGATLFIIMFVIIISIIHIPRLIITPQRHDEWTSAFIAVAMLGIALMVGGVTPKKENEPQPQFLDIEEKQTHLPG